MLCNSCRPYGTDGDFLFESTGSRPWLQPAVPLGLIARHREPFNYYHSAEAPEIPIIGPPATFSPNFGRQGNPRPPCGFLHGAALDRNPVSGELIPANNGAIFRSKSRFATNSTAASTMVTAIKRTLDFCHGGLERSPGTSLIQQSYGVRNSTIERRPVS